MASLDHSRNPNLTGGNQALGAGGLFGAFARLGNRLSHSGRELLLRVLPIAEKQVAGQVSRTDAFLALANALLSVRGEASGVALATDLLELYQLSDMSERQGYFNLLSTQFGPDEARLAACIEQYRAKGSAELPALSRAVEAPRQELFRRLNLAPGGTEALVRMRADLLTLLDRDASFENVDADSRHLLQSWFNRGFLSMRSIDWSSPASLLERLIRYEAVHDITSWADLRGRLDPEDRRCFAFFHPAMPHEPLIFVEVALTREIPGNIQALLDAGREVLPADRATTAVFYSISNCQPGLRGISFGHFLIKQVAQDLKREHPGLKTFVTLSPVPGLMKWMRSVAITPEERSMLDALGTDQGFDSLDDKNVQAFLLRHAVTYFADARNPNDKPIDPVARFHLGNGARLEQLNWRGDMSVKGLKQSAGLMVNYLYDLAAIEENHESYVERGEVRTGAPFKKLQRALAAGWPKAT